MERILVVDQATINTAYNIIELKEGKPSWVCCSMIKLDGKDAIGRMKQLYDFLSNVIDEYGIDTVVFEEVPVSRKTNLNTTVVLLKLLGIMELLACQKQIEVHIMNVNYWKSKAGITSRTRNDQKLESIDLACKRWSTYKSIIAKSDDVADALNMGYAFLKDKKII